jgi:peptide-methionine (S)-S-oxide reductase
MKSKLIFFLVTILLAAASGAAADKTVLAGGCFWCMEADFEKLAGVTEVISGFTGGTLKNPTYNGNHQGHFEAVKITYNPQKISYKVYRWNCGRDKRLKDIWGDMAAH